MAGEKVNKALDGRGKTVLKMSGKGQDLSIVSAGAVGKTFHFQKSKTGGVSMKQEQIMKALKEAAELKDEQQAFEVLKANLGDDKKATAALAALRLLKEAKGEDSFPDGFINILNEILGVTADSGSEDDEIDMDSIPEDQKDYVLNLINENKTLKDEKKNKEEQDSETEHIQKAKGFPSLFEDPESVGPVLKNFSDKLNPEEFGWFENVLSIAEKQSEKLSSVSNELEETKKELEKSESKNAEAQEKIQAQDAIIAEARGESTVDPDKTNPGTGNDTGSDQNNEDLWGGLGLPETKKE